MTRPVLAATLAATIILGAVTACGGGSSPSASTSTSSPGQAPDTFSARFDTTRGPFVVTVTRSWAPLGADRFYELVRDHFYDNQPFFRVMPGFIVQWGISSNPSVAREWETKTIKDDPPTQSNAKGTITFAIGGPDTRTTQVFVNLADNSFLDTQGFSPFGTVTSGFSVLNHLYSGYGDTANEEGAFTQKGGSWVHQNFPHMDWIKTARLVQ